MKNFFRFPVYYIIFSVFIFSCSPSENREKEESANNFSADTAKVHQLLDSFMYYMDRNSILMTYPFAENALAISKKINYEEGMADAFRYLGLYYTGVGDYLNAMESQFSALKRNEKNKNKNKIARNYTDIGIIYYNQKNFNEAVEYYQKAANIFRETENKNGIATNQYLIALVYEEQGRDTTALQYFNLSLDMQKQLGEVKRIPECERAIGDIYLKRKQYSEALSFYNSAYIHFTQVKETMGPASINLSLAKLFLQKNELDSAEKFALTSYRYFEDIHYSTRVMDSYRLLHKIYAAKNDFAKAYFYQNALIALGDSVQGEETLRKLADLKNKYGRDKQQAEIVLQQKQIKTQQTLRNFFMIGFGIVFILAFLTYRQYRVKKITAQKLEETLEHLRKTQEQLVYTEKMSSLGKLSAGIAHEIQNPLNFVNNFSDLGIGLMDELKTVSSEEERVEIMSDLRSNLEKISEHGKRADGIVKSMLNHTHIGSREKRPTDLNQLANEFFTLAYQSFRAKEPGFVCEIEKQFDKNIPMLDINPQDISRVMINLFNNALYALNKKYMESENYSPKLKMISQRQGNKVIFSIWENGTGIPDEIRQQIFQPFFTTKSVGDGTGLGLSLSYDIITQGHGGTLEVKSVEGEGSEFIITLPA